MESAIVWMGDIEQSMNAAYIIEAFHNVGYKVIDVKEIFHKTTGDRANYCFVDFGDINVAREVLIKVNNEPIPGTKSKRFRLNRSEFGRASGGSVEYSLFVGDLTPDVSDDHLLDFFRIRYPSARAAKVVKDDEGKPKGFGFVRFFDEEEHGRALKEMQGMSGLGQRRLRVNRAAKSKNQPSNQNSQPGGMDPSNFPGWMQMQMNYMQQMHQYMQQCQQFAQQAASYAGWYPDNETGGESNNSKKEESTESMIAFIEQQHEQMVAQTADVNEDQDLVDPSPPCDVLTLNQEIIDLDDKLFYELDASRWDPELAIFAATEQRPVRVR